MSLPVRLLLITFAFFLTFSFLSPSIALSNHGPFVTPIPPDSQTLELEINNDLSTAAEIYFSITTNYEMNTANEPKISIYGRGCNESTASVPYVSGEEIIVHDLHQFGHFRWTNMPTGVNFSAEVIDATNGKKSCVEGTTPGSGTATLLVSGDGTIFAVTFTLESPSIDWNNPNKPPTIQVWPGAGCTGNRILFNGAFGRVSDTVGRTTWDLGSYLEPDYTGPYSARSSNPTSDCVNRQNTPDPPIPNTRPESANCPTFVETNPSTAQQGEPLELIFNPDDTYSVDNYRLIIAGTASGSPDLVERGGKWVATITPDRSGVFSVRILVSDAAGGGQCTISNNFSIDEPWGSGFLGDNLTGWLPQRVQKVVNSLLGFGLGIAGGVAFLLLVYGSFRFIFSAGDPKAVAAGREIITAAVIGLLVIIFSIFLLRLIGISILGIPI